MQPKVKSFLFIAISLAAWFTLGGNLQAKYVTEDEIIAYPNPLNPVSETLTIKPKNSAGFAGTVEYIVYDYNQREVYRNTSSAGSSIRWSGYDAAGRRVAPGLYYIKLIHVRSNQNTSVTIIKVIIE